MYLLNRYIFPLCVFFLSFSLSADPRIQTDFYYAEGGESLREFLENKVGIPKRTLNSDGYFQKIKKWNPRIKDDSPLSANQRVYVEVPYNVTLSPKPAEKQLLEKTPGRKTSSSPAPLSPLPTATSSQKGAVFDDEKEEESVWNSSLFYMLSRGSFESEIEETGVVTESSQNSPITLGFSASRPLSGLINERWSYSGSLYLSTLNGASAQRDVEVAIPPEFGITSHLGYKRENWPVQVYSGVDIERFSSFNTLEIAQGAPLSTRDHLLTYLTFGVAKGFSWWSKNFLAKLSFSQSILSSQSRPSKVNPEEFSGSKLLFYLNMKISEDWFAHTLYKQHTLDGATGLTISRLGVGFGYSF